MAKKKKMSTIDKIINGTVLTTVSYHAPFTTHSHLDWIDIHPLLKHIQIFWNLFFEIYSFRGDDSISLVIQNTHGKFNQAWCFTLAIQSLKTEICQTLSLLVAPKVVVKTTYGATNDDKVSIIKIFGKQWWDLSQIAM